MSTIRRPRTRPAKQGSASPSLVYNGSTYSYPPTGSPGMDGLQVSTLTRIPAAGGLNLSVPAGYNDLLKENEMNWLFKLCQEMLPTVMVAEGSGIPGQERYGMTYNGVEKAALMGWIGKTPLAVTRLHAHILASEANARAWMPYILFAHGYLGLRKHMPLLRLCRHKGDIAYLIDIFWQYGYGYSTPFYARALREDPFATKPGGARRAALRERLRNARYS